MKKCITCDEIKPEDNFYFKDKKSDTRRSSCKDCHNKKTRNWQNKNREKVREYVRKSCKNAYDANPEKYKEKSRIRREKNLEKSRKIVNKSYKKIYTQRRTQERARINANIAAKRAATPFWLTAIHKAQIREYYEIAKAREMQTGIKYHVDHIIPINGIGVCGLHVPWNLQILSASENCAKKNRIFGE